MPAQYTHHFALRNKINGRYFVAVPEVSIDPRGIAPESVVYTYEDTVDTTIPFCEPPTLFATSELAEEVKQQIQTVEKNLQLEVVPVSCILK